MCIRDRCCRDIADVCAAAEGHRLQLLSVVRPCQYLARESLHGSRTWLCSMVALACFVCGHVAAIAPCPPQEQVTGLTRGGMCRPRCQQTTSTWLSRSLPSDPSCSPAGSLVHLVAATCVSLLQACVAAETWHVCKAQQARGSVETYNERPRGNNKYRHTPCKRDQGRWAVLWLGCIAIT